MAPLKKVQAQANPLNTKAYPNKLLSATLYIPIKPRNICIQLSKTLEKIPFVPLFDSFRLPATSLNSESIWLVPFDIIIITNWDKFQVQTLTTWAVESLTAEESELCILSSHGN